MDKPSQPTPAAAAAAAPKRAASQANPCEEIRAARKAELEVRPPLQVVTGHRSDALLERLPSQLSGTLEKQGRFLKRFTPRYAELKGNVLLLYKNNAPPTPGHPRTPSTIVPLDGYAVSHVDGSDIISLTHENRRSYQFRVPRAPTSPGAAPTSSVGSSVCSLAALAGIHLASCHASNASHSSPSLAVPADASASSASSSPAPSASASSSSSSSASSASRSASSAATAAPHRTLSPPLGMPAPLIASHGVKGDYIPIERWVEVIRAQASKRAAFSVNDFQLVRKLGQGGYGEVFLVSRRSTLEQFAVKQIYKRVPDRVAAGLAGGDRVAALSKLSPRERMEQQLRHVRYLTEERAALQELGRHPFVVHMSFAFQDADAWYIGLEFLRNGELFELAKKQPGRRLPEASVRAWATELVLALEYLQSHGYAHRDIKPENILLDGEGHMRLADFGFAKRLLTDDGQAGGRSNTFCGTKYYLPPEMLTGSRSHTDAVDWWALGVLMYELLTGRPPFYHKNVHRLYRKILTDDVRFPSDLVLSDEARLFIVALMRKNPASRLQGGAQVRAHPWFAGVDWAQVLRREVPIPHFDDLLTGTRPLSSEVAAAAAAGVAAPVDALAQHVAAASASANGRHGGSPTTSGRSTAHLEENVGMVAGSHHEIADLGVTLPPHTPPEGGAPRYRAGLAALDEAGAAEEAAAEEEEEEEPGEMHAVPECSVHRRVHAERHLLDAIDDETYFRLHGFSFAANADELDLDHFGDESSVADSVSPRTGTPEQTAARKLSVPTPVAVSVSTSAAAAAAASTAAPVAVRAPVSASAGALSTAVASAAPKTGVLAPSPGPATGSLPSKSPVLTSSTSTGSLAAETRPAMATERANSGGSTESRSNPNSSDRTRVGEESAASSTHSQDAAAVEGAGLPEAAAIVEGV